MAYADGTTSYAEDVVKHYVDKGYANATDEITLVSLDGDTEVILDTQVNESNESSGIDVVIDGTVIYELSFSDEEFQQKLSLALAEALNI